MICLSDIFVEFYFLYKQPEFTNYGLVGIICLFLICHTFVLLHLIGHLFSCCDVKNMGLNLVIVHISHKYLYSVLSPALSRTITAIASHCSGISSLFWHFHI